ncbi:hypothetical protein MHU86_7900 [Fragilaria crotonensis]|nr:hypothetical protein MHU86_7900 [Fragilaria crotonensis]
MSEDNGKDKKRNNTATSKKQNLNPGRLNPYKSLASYLKYLEGEELIVELKNGCQFTGILQHAEEPSMNLTLAVPNRQSTSTSSTGSAVASINQTGDTSTGTVDASTQIERRECEPEQPTLKPSSVPQFRPLHLRGPAIRYIHFTADNYLATIRANQDRERSAKQKYQRGLRK